MKTLACSVFIAVQIDGLRILSIIQIIIIKKKCPGSSLVITYSIISFKNYITECFNICTALVELLYFILKSKMYTSLSVYFVCNYTELFQGMHVMHIIIPRNNYLKIKCFFYIISIISKYLLTPNFSLAGNEFWMGSLSTSDGPSAACSSSIAELHNPHVNSRVAAKHLRVVTRDHGLETVAEHVARLRRR